MWSGFPRRLYASAQDWGQSPMFEGQICSLRRAFTTNFPYPDPQLIHLRCPICAAHALSLLKYSLSRVYRHELMKESRLVPS
jgi:hypothetical protein